MKAKNYLLQIGIRLWIYITLNLIREVITEEDGMIEWGRIQNKVRENSVMGEAKSLKPFPITHLQENEKSQIYLDSYIRGNMLQYSISINSSHPLSNFVQIPHNIHKIQKELEGGGWRTKNNITSAHVYSHISGKYLTYLNDLGTLYFYNITMLEAGDISFIYSEDSEGGSTCGPLISFDSPLYMYFCEEPESSQGLIKYVSVFNFTNPSDPYFIFKDQPNYNKNLRSTYKYLIYGNNYLLVFNKSMDKGAGGIIVYKIYLSTSTLELRILAAIIEAVDLGTDRLSVKCMVMTPRSIQTPSIMLGDSQGYITLLTFNPQYQLFKIASRLRVITNGQSINTCVFSSLCSEVTAIISVDGSDEIYELDVSSISNPKVVFKYSIYTSPYTKHPNNLYPPNQYRNLGFQSNQIIGVSKDYILAVYMNLQQKCAIRVIRRYADSSQFIEYVIEVEYYICGEQMIMLEAFNIYQNSFIILENRMIDYVKVSIPVLTLDSSDVPPGVYTYVINATQLYSQNPPLFVNYTVQVLSKAEQGQITLLGDGSQQLLHAKIGDRTPVYIKDYVTGDIGDLKYTAPQYSNYTLFVMPKIQYLSLLPIPLNFSNKVEIIASKFLVKLIMCENRSCSVFEANIETGRMTPIPHKSIYYKEKYLGVFGVIKYKMLALTYTTDRGTLLGVFNISINSNQYGLFVLRFRESTHYVKEELLVLDVEEGETMKYSIAYSVRKQLLYITHYSSLCECTVINVYTYTGTEGGLPVLVYYSSTTHNVDRLKLSISSPLLFAIILSNEARLYNANKDPGLGNPISVIKGVGLIGGEIIEEYMVTLHSGVNNSYLNVYDISDPVSALLLKSIELDEGEYITIAGGNIRRAIYHHIGYKVFLITEEVDAQKHQIIYYLRVFDISMTLSNSYFMKEPINCNHPYLMTPSIHLSNILLFIQNETHICTYRTEYDQYVVVTAKRTPNIFIPTVFSPTLQLQGLGRAQNTSVKLTVSINESPSNLFITALKENDHEFDSEELDLSEVFSGFNISYELLDPIPSGAHIIPQMFYSFNQKSLNLQNIRFITCTKERLFALSGTSLVGYDWEGLNNKYKFGLAPFQVSLIRYNLDSMMIKILNANYNNGYLFLLYGLILSKTEGEQIKQNLGMVFMEVGSQTRVLKRYTNYYMAKDMLYDPLQSKLIILEEPSNPDICGNIIHKTSNNIYMYDVSGINSSTGNILPELSPNYTISDTSFADSQFENFMATCIALNPARPGKLFIGIDNYGVLIYDYINMEFYNSTPIASKLDIQGFHIVGIASAFESVFVVMRNAGILRLCLHEKEVINYDYWTLWDRNITLSSLIHTSGKYLAVVGSTNIYEGGEIGEEHLILIVLKVINWVTTPLFVRWLPLQTGCNSLYISLHRDIYIQITLTCLNTILIRKYYFSPKLYINKDHVKESYLQFGVRGSNAMSYLERTFIYRKPSWVVLIVCLLVALFLLILGFGLWIRKRRKDRRRGRLIKLRENMIQDTINEGRLRMGIGMVQNNYVEDDKYGNLFHTKEL